MYVEHIEIPYLLRELFPVSREKELVEAIGRRG